MVVKVCRGHDFPDFAEWNMDRHRLGAVEIAVGGIKDENVRADFNSVPLIGDGPARIAAKELTCFALPRAAAVHRKS